MQTLAAALLLVAGLVSTSCASDSTEFKGGGSQIKQAPSSEGEPAPPAAEARAADTGSGQPSAPASSAPQGAVTKGSFTAWTEPERPSPGQAYRIHVEIHLPASVSSYDAMDLSGQVIGTDGYTQGIGRDAPAGSGAFDASSSQFRYSGQTAQLTIQVPGADKLVRDTIDIHSDLLDERQSLEIIFK